MVIREFIISFNWNTFCIQFARKYWARSTNLAIIQQHQKESYRTWHMLSHWHILGVLKSTHQVVLPTLDSSTASPGSSNRCLIDTQNMGFAAFRVKSLNDQRSWCFRQRPVSPPCISCPQIRLLVLVHKYLGNLVLLVAAHLFIDDVSEAHRQQQGCCNLIKYHLPFCLPMSLPKNRFPSLFPPASLAEQKMGQYCVRIHSLYKVQIGQVQLTQSCDPQAESHHCNTWTQIFNLRCVYRCRYIDI